MSISVAHLTKRYGAENTVGPVVLDDINVELGENEVVTVLGPSGSGKTTLLNCIAGLEEYEGTITIDGVAVRRPLPGVAVVFQSPHLLPWRTTIANVEYGLEVGSDVPKQARRARAAAALERVGLAGAADHYPAQLSGGMQQRTNIARALATEPSVLLMDEPFGALDAITRERLQEELQTIIVKSAVSVLFITHDIGEAIYLGDRVVVLGAHPGRIRQVMTVGEPRPRSLKFKHTEEFQAMYSELWEAL